MRQSFIIASVATAFTLACLQCAPADGTRRVGHIQKMPGSSSLYQQQQQKYAAQNTTCSGTPQRAKLQTIRDATTKRASGAAIPFNQLPAGTYTLAAYGVNFSILATDINYESDIEFSVQTSGGSNLTVTPTCRSDVAAGHMKAPATVDNGHSFLIDTRFQLAAQNGAVALDPGSVAKTVLVSQIGNGSSPQVALRDESDPTAQAMLQNNANKSIAEILAVSSADKNNRDYPNFFQTRQQSDLTIIQLTQSTYQIYLDVPEDNSTPNVPERRGVFLVYQWTQPSAPAAAPTAPTQQQTQLPPVPQQQTQVQQQSTTPVATPTGNPPDQKSDATTTPTSNEGLGG